MAYLLGRFKTDDFDAWKEQFDADPLGRRQAARGHRVLRNAEDPNEFFVQTEFASADEARSFRDKLMGSDAFASMNAVLPPAVAEEVDAQTY